jgi:drug/metabolite transporter (DMT)-like permease
LAAGGAVYLGAALGAALLLVRRKRKITRSLLRGRSLASMVIVALLGGLAAPVLLILGLKRADAATASLLLAMEAPFTLVLARLFFAEHLGRRVSVAAALIVVGGLVLGARSPVSGTTSVMGMALVVGASLAWALDNLVSRGLADQDPLVVVMLKGLIGSGAALSAATVMGESLPPLARFGPLLVLGALGYGVSLQLYLRAQTLVGAARTASIFATAPFVGAIAALLLGSPWPGWPLPVAACLMIAGIGLHLSERHGHHHHHQATDHEHMHTHDDGHHLHEHHPMPLGPHSHPHRHDPITHDHEHSEDLHHRHPH